MKFSSVNDLGGLFFLWEFATSITAYVLQINPFDQPNVESAKKAARVMAATYATSGLIPQEEPALRAGSFAVFGDISSNSAEEIVKGILGAAKPGNYLALQAFLTPDEMVTEKLQNLRRWVSNNYGLATTLGYGPRFLHSTGQLHKGDSGNGIFFQFTADPIRDVPIPLKAGSSDSSMTFGTLIRSQALGDQKALRDAGRRVLQFHFDQPVNNGLADFLNLLMEGKK
jgi:glucose-6-phosphate isomerase/transaldolase/glucose-6-phosphate isomerase